MIRTIVFLEDSKIKLYWKKPRRQQFGWVLKGTIVHARYIHTTKWYRMYELTPYITLQVVKRYRTREEPATLVRHETTGNQELILDEEAAILSTR